MLSEYLGVRAGHPPKVKAIAQTDKKIDRIDPTELSRLLWQGSVLENYIPNDDIRECCVPVEGGSAYWRNGHFSVNKIHTLFGDNELTRNVSPLSRQGQTLLDKLSLPAPWDGLQSSDLAVSDTLIEELNRLDKRIEEAG